MFMPNTLTYVIYLDIDPCLERDVCDQLCVDLNGNQTCSCHKDYWMDGVTGECRVKGKCVLHN